MKSSTLLDLDPAGLLNSQAEMTMARIVASKAKTQMTLLEFQSMHENAPSEEIKAQFADLVRAAQENYDMAVETVNKFIEAEEKRRDVLVRVVIDYLEDDVRKSKFTQSDAVLVKAYLSTRFSSAESFLQKIVQLNENRNTSLEGSCRNIVQMEGGMLLKDIEKHLRECNSIDSKIGMLFPRFKQIVIDEPTAQPCADKIATPQPKLKK